MKHKEIVSLLEDLDISEIRPEFESVHTHWMDKDFIVSQTIAGKFIELIFRIVGRQYNNGFYLEDLGILDMKLWLNDSECAVISDGTLMRVEKILRTKVNEL